MKFIPACQREKIYIAVFGGHVSVTARDSNVHLLGYRFLSSCRSLTSVDLSGMVAVTDIGVGFLGDCPSLTSLDLSGMVAVTTIGENFLDHCRGFEKFLYQLLLFLDPHDKRAEGPAITAKAAVPGPVRPLLYAPCTAKDAEIIIMNFCCRCRHRREGC